MTQQILVFFHLNFAFFPLSRSIVFTWVVYFSSAVKTKLYEGIDGDHCFGEQLNFMYFISHGKFGYLFFDEAADFLIYYSPGMI